MSSIHSELSRGENEILEKDPHVVFKIWLEVINKHAPRKKKTHPAQ